MPVADNFKKSVLLHCIYEWCHKHINVVNVVLKYIHHYIDQDLDYIDKLAFQLAMIRCFTTNGLKRLNSWIHTISQLKYCLRLCTTGNIALGWAWSQG